MLKLMPSLSLHQWFPNNHNVSPQEAKQFHALSLKTGYINQPSISTRLLGLYADPKINNFEYARSVFDRIQEPNLVTWNIIIKCYIENQRSNDAISLFYELVHELLPDNFTLPCVIKGCARLNAIEEGKQIHGLVLKIGFGLDKFVQCSLVNMYSKCGDISLARKVFDQMNDKDLVSWNSLIDGYARNGEVEIALELFDEMPDKDAFSWTALIDGFSKCGKVEMAREIFDQMPSKNLVSWNAMINGYMKSGKLDLAHHLFHQIPTRNLISWNSMIGGYELNGKFSEALKLFQELLKNEFMPSHATLLSALSAVSGLAILSNGRWIHSFIVKHGFELDGVLGTSLIEMYSKCGSIESALAVFQAISNKKLGHWTAIIVGFGMHGLADQAIELFHEMRRTGLTPHAITFIGLLNACSHTVDILCRAGHLKEAKNIIESMPMRPNKVIWMSLLGGSRNHGNLEIGEYAAWRLIEVDRDTVGCYVVLSNMYAAAGQWDKVSHLRELMKKWGVKKEPGCSSIEHGGVLHEFIVGDKSHQQTREIYGKLKEMREKLKLVGHVPDTSQVLLYIEEEKEKESELEIHSERLAIAFGLISLHNGSPIRIIKNLRVCNDCHTVTKLLSDIYKREIIVRDNSRFHHFKDGSCSCKDFW
ncbi:Pentatricopeptide repeat [Quillaja saponaria]|uniref:Pentatricopeptide repeat n=1 Tax=Quillaja saponaria TaxID=32244 RepID=A0AAD7LV33_QUISA|nr:Pentatricopeptide repeat [Quillaja saponaria]